MNNNSLIKSTPFFVVTVFFIEFLVGWILLQILKPAGDSIYHYFGAVYGLVALIGGSYGIAVSKRWGGARSSLGRTIVYLSVGLLLAEFGQLVFSYYNIVLHEAAPYPSIADIGFFGNVPFYIIAAMSLYSVVGLNRKSSNNALKYLAMVIVPPAILFSSYWIFLREYSTEGLSKLNVFLDFGYPIGQAAYISISLVILVSVTGALGGMMRPRVWMLLLAFIAQYVADFNFLYQSYHGTWSLAGYGDLLYLLAYYLMAVSLIYLSLPVSNSVTSNVNAQSVVPLESNNG